MSNCFLAEINNNNSLKSLSKNAHNILIDNTHLKAISQKTELMNLNKLNINMIESSNLSRLKDSCNKNIHKKINFEIDNSKFNFPIKDKNENFINKANSKEPKNKIEVNFIKYFFYQIFKKDFGNIVKFNDLLESLMEYLNIENIIIKLNDIEKLKYILFDEKQRKIIEESKFINKKFFSHNTYYNVFNNNIENKIL